MLKVGYSKKQLLSPIGIQLAGYDCIRKAIGIHDPLYCKVLVINNKDKQLCFVQFDVLCVCESFVEKIQNVAKKYHFVKEHIFIGATHTHSAPKGLCSSLDRVLGVEGIFGEYDDKFTQSCLDVFEECLQEACSSTIESLVKISYQTVNDICSERHSLQYSYDQKLWKIEFNRIDQSKLLLYNYSCHPTILHADNLEVSADFSGSASKYLEEDYDFVIFYNGSAGDVSTRFTRQGMDFNEVERVGFQLAKEIKQDSCFVVYEGVFEDILIEHKCFHLKARSDKRIDDMAQYVISLKEQYVKDKTSENLKLYQEACTNYEFICTVKYPLDKNNIIIDITLLKIEDIFIIMIPAEITSALTLELTQKYQCLIFGYTNGYNLYISSKESFERKYYESSLSLFEKGEGEKLIHFIDEWIQKYK